MKSFYQTNDKKSIPDNEEKYRFAFVLLKGEIRLPITEEQLRLLYFISFFIQIFIYPKLMPSLILSGKSKQTNIAVITYLLLAIMSTFGIGLIGILTIIPIGFFVYSTVKELANTIDREYRTVYLQLSNRFFYAIFFTNLAIILLRLIIPFNAVYFLLQYLADKL